MSEAVGDEIQDLLEAMRKSAAKLAGAEFVQLTQNTTARAAAKRIVDEIRVTGQKEAHQNALAVNRLLQSTIGAGNAETPIKRLTRNVVEPLEHDESLLINQVMLGALVRRDCPALAQFWIGPRVKARPQINLGETHEWAPKEQAAKSQGRDLGLIAALTLEAGLPPFDTKNEIFTLSISAVPQFLAPAAQGLVEREATSLMRFAEHYDTRSLAITDSVVTQFDR